MKKTKLSHLFQFYLSAAVLAVFLSSTGRAEELRIELKPAMLINEFKQGDPQGIIDEQRKIIGQPQGEPKTTWKLNPKFWKQAPISAYLDLGKEKNLSSLWIYDTNGNGDVIISVGKPGAWKKVATYDCKAYKKWAKIKLDVTTRYLQITRTTEGANFSEIAVYEYSEQAYRERVQQKAEKARREIERQAMLQKAREEALRRPVFNFPPYGRLSLVDEIICAEDDSHAFSQYPRGTSRVEKILGKQARVLPLSKGEATYFSYRIGRMKLLRPGAKYVLTVEYPEDAPRSMVVINTGNETSLGFHTGATVGDALHVKYVNNLSESVQVPLSKTWKMWSLLIHLHDRFAERGLLRGSQPRPLSPEDGFEVTIAQFSAKNIPLSQGAAVRSIRLYEVIDSIKLAQPLARIPKGLPHRRLFWREEMADGVIDYKIKQPGITKPIDWYRYKAERMKFLGMNTFSKDLLEFGACQHWDSTPHGGNDWVFHNAQSKGLWAEIVSLMGEYGFDILPYYEYSGSKGYHGLGNERRAQPLTRNDGYSPFKWIEEANADITDPDTISDFQKILDLTIIKHRREAAFAGAWIRPRSQMPISFSDKAIQRFVSENSIKKRVTRSLLQEDKVLYQKYIVWWHKKRKDFLLAMRDYLRENGVSKGIILSTGCPDEPGVPFNSWQPRIVTNCPELWKPILQHPEHIDSNRGAMEILSITDVVEKNLYLKSLVAPGLSWGDWELHHSRPADDPQNYKDVQGVLLSHAFNRNYTVSSPSTFDAYRTATGLAIVRHYSLNENMMFDKNDKEILGYFVADIERAGSYCMMAEALAMAKGDPTMIGYLVGSNYGRGFPEYVRNFNANFLALPALPSSIRHSGASNEKVVVRQINTDNHGSWLMVINTSLEPQTDVTVSVPEGRVTDAVTGEEMGLTRGRLTLELYPFQLRSFRIQ